MEVTSAFGRWQHLAGAEDREPWTKPEQLAGLFQAFRPSGNGVDAVFTGLPAGEAVLRRMKRVYRATSAAWEPQRPILDAFVVERPPRMSEKSVLDLLRKHRDLAVEISRVTGDGELEATLRSAALTIARSKGPDWSELGAWMHEDRVEFMSSMVPLDSPVLLLKEAFYTVAYDAILMYYLMWPLFAHSSPVNEPFEPYFELWRHGWTVEASSNSGSGLTAYRGARSG